MSLRPEVGFKVELTRLRPLKVLLRWRPLQWTLTVPTLFFFTLAILAGLVGTPVGNRNFAIIFVWIVWWALLILLLLPLGGRLWCLMCPIPSPGEWLQRRAIIGPGEQGRSARGRKWPRRLDNIWLQNLAFLLVALFSAVILTRPLATGLILLAFVLLAVGASLLFRRRAFCRYLCPVGGFIGLYALFAPLELRVRDEAVCRAHRGRECYTGSEQGYGCPWLVFPWQMQRNAPCGLCTECLKTCPEDNVALNLRPFAADLLVGERRLDEAYKALIMLACALLYSAVFLGPWGWLKDWANLTPPSSFALYAVLFLGLNLLLLPGLFFLCTFLAWAWQGRQGPRPARLFVDYAYALVPLGLLGWMAFSLSFVAVNLSYALPVLSDPLGWGWNLLGTVGYPWTPYGPEWLPYLQVPTLILGLLSSIWVAHRISQQHDPPSGRAWRGLLPIAAFLTGVTLVFLYLYLG